MGGRDDAAFDAAVEMASGTVARDLLKATLQELQLMQKPWVQMTQAQQSEVIERLRARTEDNVRRATHIIGAQGRKVLDVVLLKPGACDDGIKATILTPTTNPLAWELPRYHKQTVLLVLGSADEHMDGLDDVKATPDQRAMDLGHEYDPNGDGKGMEGHFQPGNDDNVVDVIAIEHQPLDSELDQAYRDGWWAATHEQSKDSCPVMDRRLVAQWTQGWSDFKDGLEPKVSPFVRKEGEAEGDEAAVTGDASQDLDTASDASASTQDDPVDAAPEVADAPEAKPAARKASAKKSTAKKGGRK